MTDRIVLKTDGFELSGFDIVSVKNRIDWLAGYFDLTATNKALSALNKAKAHVKCGADCTLSVDGKKAFTGYIDKVVKGYLNGLPCLRIVGSSLVGDAVESDLTGKTYKNQTAPQILNDILSGCNIGLNSRLIGCETLDVFTANPAEKCLSAIARLLDRTNAVLFSTTDGTLCLTRRENAEPANVQIITGQSDVVAASCIDDGATDFAKIVLIGQNGLADEHDIASICGASMETVLPSERHKQKVVYADNVSQSRLDKEAAKCRKAQKKITLSVKGWQTVGLNSVVAVSDDWLDLNGGYRIAGLCLSFDEKGGHRTTFELEATDV